MENSEEILHSLEEFSKFRPKDIPRELEEYLCFVAKTGDPVYQWSAIKSLFREKLINVVTEFYESCPSVDIPPCPNVEMFNYDSMKNFILEKLDTFASAPFTVQRICELLTSPRKEYNRIDKFMRALEKNILVVSTTEPGGRRAENGDGLMNGVDSEHLPETSNCSNDINVEEMDDSPAWPRGTGDAFNLTEESQSEKQDKAPEPETELEEKSSEASDSSQDSVIARTDSEPYISIEALPKDCLEPKDVSVNITTVPAGVQKRRSSVEPESSETEKEDVKTVEKPEESLTVAKPKEESEAVREEDRLILSSAESGIENISPESSTSSPETLQEEIDGVPVEPDCSESAQKTAEPDTSKELPQPEETTTEENQAEEVKEEEKAEEPSSSKDVEITSTSTIEEEKAKIEELRENVDSSDSSSSLPEAPKEEKEQGNEPEQSAMEVDLTEKEKASPEVL